MLNKIIHNGFFKMLNNLEYGQLELTTPDGKIHLFKGRKKGVSSKFKLFEWDVIKNLSTKGDIGLAEDYRDGRWETDNLTNLFKFSLQNYSPLKQYIQGNGIFKIISKLSYLTKRNTVKGSKNNIHAHYDLGNDFYDLWLDSTMSYSSALFINNNEDLAIAQNDKYDRILNRLGNDPKQILEIGCGWGGFAERAVQTKDHKVKGITLSTEQLDFSKAKLPADKTEIILEDYRHTKGTFDAIVSIEMFEAVGEKYWPVYFKRIAELLKKDGKAVIQTITINDDGFEEYRKSGDMIRSFIFPGGMLPSKSRFYSEAEKAGLKVTNSFSFGQDYAKTLDIWLGKFDDNLDAIKKMGFDDNFIRLWRLYLASCSASFTTEHTDVMQVELQHA